MARFGDYDGMARLALVGSLAAVLSFVLPWASFRPDLQVVDFSGAQLVVAPALLAQIGTPGGLAAGLGVALVALVALLAGLASLLLALAPGLKRAGAPNVRAGRDLAAVGLGAALLEVVLVAVWLGPQVGVTQVQYGAAVGVLGFLLAAAAWPRARLVGEAEATAGATPPSGPEVGKGA